MKRVVQFTTVHPRQDTRLRVKEVATLARSLDADVLLMVQDGLGDERVDDPGYTIRDTGPRPRRRIARMTAGAWRMYRAVRAERPAAAHFHDPELIPVGLLLKLSGVKVVYDVHEDVPGQIMSKYYLPLAVRAPVARIVGGVEWLASQLFDAIVPANPMQSKKFPPRKMVLVQNFPMLSELAAPDAVPYAERPPHFVYVGGLTEVRGAMHMVRAVGMARDPRVRLHLGGLFGPESLRTRAESLDGWSRVDYHGWANRDKIARLLGNSRAGLVTLHPTRSHVSAYPVKLFEYMSAGLPVICSDIPLWRGIVEDAGCGLLVDPLDPGAIAGAMQWILDHPEEAAEMGRRGRRAVEERYNWDREAEKLVALYHERFGIPLRSAAGPGAGN